MPERFGSNESTYDSLRALTIAQSVPPTSSPAGLNAQFVTLAADGNLTNERVLTAGRRMGQVDSGAGAAITYGVVDSKRLIVDPDGYGDYTTISAALNYAAQQGGNWVVDVVTGTYSERIEPVGPVGGGGSGSAVLRGMGSVTINPVLSGSQTAIKSLTNFGMEFRNLTVSPTGTSSTAVLVSWGSGSVSFYDCTLIPLASQKLHSSNSTIYLYRCTIGLSGRTFSAGLLASNGTSFINAWDCDIIGTATASFPLVYTAGVQTFNLYYCRIVNGGGPTALDIGNYSVAINVLRCAYNRTKTTGTITVIDGDIPALSVADIPAHSILSTTHGDTTAAAVVRGDLIVGQGASPTWSRYALSVPAAGTLNYLGVNNGETEPTWKSASSNPGAAPSLLATDSSGGLIIDSGTLAVNATSHKAGFGTNNPDAKFEIVSTGILFRAKTPIPNWQSLDFTLSAGAAIKISTNYGGTETERALILGTYSNSANQLALIADGSAGIGIAAPAARLHIVKPTTTANAAVEVLRVESRVSTASGGAAGFGSALTLYAESSVDGTYRQQAQIDATWATATDASRKAKMVLSAYDTAQRIGIEIYADGTRAMIGLCGTSPTARLHLPAGSATATTAPLKFTAGDLLSVIELGALEFDGDYFYSTSGYMTGVNHRRRVVSDDRVVIFNDEYISIDDNLVLL